MSATGGAETAPKPTSITSLSIVSDTSRIGDVLTCIKDIMARAESGDASASRTTTRIKRLFDEPSKAVRVTLRSGADPLQLRVEYFPTPALLSLIEQENGA